MCEMMLLLFGFVELVLCVSGFSVARFDGLEYMSVHLHFLSICLLCVCVCVCVSLSLTLFLSPL